MEENYKYLFMKYIYEKLNLQEIEKEILNKGIKSQKKIEQSTISNYFILLNEIHIERLTGNLREKFNYYFSLPFEELCNPNLKNEINNFLEETYKLLLFPDLSNPYYYYGPIEHKYTAPSDAIVLGFCYKEFDIDVSDDKFEEFYFQRKLFLNNYFNSIQYEIAPKMGFKIAIIKYNEFIGMIR